MTKLFFHCSPSLHCAHIPFYCSMGSRKLAADVQYTQYCIEQQQQGEQCKKKVLVAFASFHWRRRALKNWRHWLKNPEKQFPKASHIVHTYSCSSTCVSKPQLWGLKLCSYREQMSIDTVPSVLFVSCLEFWLLSLVFIGGAEQ